MWYHAGRTHHRRASRSRWVPTPDHVLPTETFDEHAADTMMKAGLYTWTVGEANRTEDKWQFVANTGDVARGEALVEGETHLYSTKAYRLLSKAAGPKGKPPSKEQLKQEMAENTALISKIASWTRAGLTANYVHKTEDQKSID